MSTAYLFQFHRRFWRDQSRGLRMRGDFPSWREVSASESTKTTRSLPGLIATRGMMKLTRNYYVSQYSQITRTTDLKNTPQLLYIATRRMIMKIGCICIRIIRCCFSHHRCLTPWQSSSFTSPGPKKKIFFYICRNMLTIMNVTNIIYNGY